MTVAARAGGGPRRPLHSAAIAALFLCAPAGSLAAQAPQPITIRGLGTLSFPTSTRSVSAESAFVRGVLLLHVFEYEDAAASFRAARQLDPGLVLAYWGEAMTHDHPVWDEEDPPAARAVLAALAPTAAEREARAGTPRERGFLHAVDLLFGEGPKARRDTLYSEAMGTLLAAYPEDDEARAFYALSLLGLSQGVRNVPTYLRAAAIAESVFARNPRHPGAAHYWIHGMDDPDHASAALPAARALSRIAPDAGHAQHMTSHIFMALGMWDDVVRANENAMRVVNAARAARGAAPSFCGHYNFWLEYGYLQQGRTDDARTLVQRCREQARPAAGDPLDPDNSALGSAVVMWARYVLDTEDWRGEVAQWTPAFGEATAPRATWAFARGFAAARRGDLPMARAALESFGQARERLIAKIAARPEPDPGDAQYRTRLDVLGLELEAEVLLASRGAADSAVALLRRATALEDSMAYAFGPPFVDEPSHELLGEVLLDLGRGGEAKRELEATLRRTPGRAAVLRGLERAGAAASGP